MKFWLCVLKSFFIPVVTGSILFTSNYTNYNNYTLSIDHSFINFVLNQLYNLSTIMNSKLGSFAWMVLYANHFSVKLRIWQAILPLLLASSTTAERAPTCTTHEVNLLQNPSFESGSLAGWSLVENNMVVVSDPHAADGHYYL